MIIARDINKELVDFMKSEFGMNSVRFVDEDELDDLEFSFELNGNDSNEVVNAMNDEFKGFVFHTTQVTGMLAIMAIPIINRL